MDITQAADTLIAEKPAFARTASRRQLAVHAAALGVEVGSLLTELRRRRSGGRPEGEELARQQEISQQAKIDHERWLARQAARDARLANADQLFVEVDAILVAAGARMEKVSESGSRYYRLMDGRPVRVADHEANGATQAWLESEAGEQVDIGGRNPVAAAKQIVD